MFVDTKVRPQGEQVDAIAPSRMKLSEAIRIGARASRPSKEYGDSPIWVIENKSGCFACLAGAAWIGTGGDRNFHSGLIPELCKRTGVTGPVLSEAMMRYEGLGESRESIADWLAAQGL